jgi:uncharacterized protein (PEP-CTERM system associated)
MTLAWAPAACALEWRIEPTLEGSAIYTDNARQSENNPTDALILTATPGVTVYSEGSSQVQATLQYDLTGVTRFYFGDDDSVDLLHKLNAAGKAELVDDFLFIDGSAFLSQELISLEGALVGAEVDDTNRANVFTYSLSPYVQKRLGTFANAQARYTASGSLYEDVGRPVSSDTIVNAVTAELTNGTRFDDVSWGLNYSIRKAEYDDLPDSTFERAVASLGYALTRKFRIFGTAGEEWNEYPTAPGNETEGSIWSVGFGWSPSRRTSIEASMGDRYFGNFYSLSARHRTRASDWNVNYAEDLNDQNNFMLTTGTVFDYLCPDPEGGLLLFSDWPSSVPPAPGCIAFGGTPGLLFDLRSGVFLSRALRAWMNWGVDKLTYSLVVFDSRRDFQLVNAEDRTQGATVALAYRLAPYTRATGSLGLNTVYIPAVLSVSGTDRDDDIYTLMVGMEHQFAADLSGTLEYQHQQRDSSIADGDFRENRVTATVNMAF